MRTLAQLAARPEPTPCTLAAEIHRHHRSLIRELRIEVVEGGVVMSGSAYSYYGKQVAQHEVLRRTGLVLLANRVVVASRTSSLDG